VSIPETQSAASPRTRIRGEDVKTFFVRYRFFHLLVLPGIVYFVVFNYLPMFGVVIAFNNYSGTGGIRGMLTSPWVGLAHFREFFGSYYFWRLLRNTLVISGLRMLFGFPAPIILAVLLSEMQGRFFKRAVQTVSYLPHFLSWVVASGLVSMLLGSEGPVNTILGVSSASSPSSSSPTSGTSGQS
jgi:putative aldouronate transport system permease protein